MTKSPNVKETLRLPKRREGKEGGREGGRRVFREERDREHSMKREILSLQERESKVRQGRKEREEV